VSVFCPDKDENVLWRVLKNLLDVYDDFLTDYDYYCLDIGGDVFCHHLYGHEKLRLRIGFCYEYAVSGLFVILDDLYYSDSYSGVNDLLRR
jgi:hypothetical protein